MGILLSLRATSFNHTISFQLITYNCIMNKWQKYYSFFCSFYLCVTFKPMTAAKRAKKNPANPVAPVNNTNSPISTGIKVKNLSLYANSSGNRNFFSFFFTFNFPRPSPFGLIPKSVKKNEINFH